MKTPFIKTRLLLASLFLAAASAGAEDIDIYAAPPPDGARPNVLVLIDNAASNNANYISTCTVGFPFAANTTKLLDMVQWASSKYPVLVIGHQPTLGQAIAQLLNLRESECAVKKGALWWLRNRDRDGQSQTVVVTVQSPEVL